jgi:hypothetical protein
MNVVSNTSPQMPGRPKATDGQWLCLSGHGAMSEFSKIFKKTPFVSGLHPVSRDVVKDVAEIASIPLLTTTTLDQDVSQGFAGAGWTIAENPTAVTPHSHQGVLRSADERTAAPGDVVGSKGNHAVRASLAVGISNGKLTGGELDARPSKWAASATNHASVVHDTFAKRNGLTSAGALGLSAGDLENHSYADI